MHELHLQLNGSEPVMSNAADVLRKSGIGNAAHHKGRVLGQILDVLLHLLRTGRTVQTEHIDRERFEN